MLLMVVILSGCFKKNPHPEFNPILAKKELAVTPKPLYGYDILGLAMQDVKMIASTIDSDRGIGVLDGTFGKAVDNLRFLLHTGKVTFFRAHLSNGPCQRNGNCEKGEPKPTDFNVLAQRARAFEALHQEFSYAKCFISPRVEHDVKDRDTVNKWYSIIKTEAPSCIPVCSAFTGFCPPGPLIEKHGNKVKSQIVSNDGQSYYDSNSPEYNKSGTVIVFNWINRDNLRTSGEKTFTPPSKRTNLLTRTDMIQRSRMLKLQPPIPALACAKPIDIKAPNIWKTNAEDYGGNPPKGRDNKPVFITGAKISRYDIFAPSGKLIGFANYGGPFDKNQSRYYTGNSSGDSGVSLMDEADGSEWGFMKGGGQCFKVNFIRRLGTSR